MAIKEEDRGEFAGTTVDNGPSTTDVNVRTGMTNDEFMLMQQNENSVYYQQDDLYHAIIKGDIERVKELTGWTRDATRPDWSGIDTIKQETAFQAERQAEDQRLRGQEDALNNVNSNPLNAPTNAADQDQLLSFLKNPLGTLTTNLADGMTALAGEAAAAPRTGENSYGGNDLAEAIRKGDWTAAARIMNAIEALRQNDAAAVDDTTVGPNNGEGMGMGSGDNGNEYIDPATGYSSNYDTNYNRVYNDFTSYYTSNYGYDGHGGYNDSYGGNIDSSGTYHTRFGSWLDREGIYRGQDGTYTNSRTGETMTTDGTVLDKDGHELRTGLTADQQHDWLRDQARGNRDVNYHPAPGTNTPQDAMATAAASDQSRAPGSPGRPVGMAGASISAEAQQETALSRHRALLADSRHRYESAYTAQNAARQDFSDGSVDTTKYMAVDDNKIIAGMTTLNTVATQRHGGTTAAPATNTASTTAPADSSVPPTTNTAASGVYTDEFGNIYDQYGGYKTATGGYMDKDGWYYESEKEGGGMWDPKGAYYGSDGSYTDPKGNYVDAQGNLYLATNTSGVPDYAAKSGVDYAAQLQQAVNDNKDWTPPAAAPAATATTNTNTAPGTTPSAITVNLTSPTINLTTPSLGTSSSSFLTNTNFSLTSPGTALDSSSLTSTGSKFGDVSLASSSLGSSSIYSTQYFDPSNIWLQSYSSPVVTPAVTTTTVKPVAPTAMA